MLRVVKVPTENPATQATPRLGRRTLTMTKLIVLVAVVGMASATVIAAVVGALLVAARELQ